MNNEVLLVFSNFPDRASAEAAANTLVAEKLAACVNILADCKSIYRWQDKTEQASEVPMIIKTTGALYPQVENVLQKLHPYEIPEIIAVPVCHGLPAYLNWVANETLPRIIA